MKTTSRCALLAVTGCVVLSSLVLFTSCARADENPVTSDMAGHWEGNARIIVTWAKATNLAVSLDIASDGGVTGKIGDATLEKGRFKSNRGWLGRKLSIKTDYIITSDLKGDVIAAEGIRRSGVNIPLTFKDGKFRGTVHTTGWEMGGKTSMKLTASPLELIRVDGPKARQF